MWLPAVSLRALVRTPPALRGFCAAASNHSSAPSSGDPAIDDRWPQLSYGFMLEQRKEAPSLKKFRALLALSKTRDEAKQALGVFAILRRKFKPVSAEVVNEFARVCVRANALDLAAKGFGNPYGFGLRITKPVAKTLLAECKIAQDAESCEKLAKVAMKMGVLENETAAIAIENLVALQRPQEGAEFGVRLVNQWPYERWDTTLLNSVLLAGFQHNGMCPIQDDVAQRIPGAVNASTHAYLAAHQVAQGNVSKAKQHLDIALKDSSVSADQHPALIGLADALQGNPSPLVLPSNASGLDTLASLLGVSFNPPTPSSDDNDDEQET